MTAYLGEVRSGIYVMSNSSALFQMEMLQTILNNQDLLLHLPYWAAE